MNTYKIVIKNGDITRESLWQSENAPEVGKTFECIGTAGEWEVVDVLEEE